MPSAENLSAVDITPELSHDNLLLVIEGIEHLNQANQADRTARAIIETPAPTLEVPSGPSFLAFHYLMYRGRAWLHRRAANRIAKLVGIPNNYESSETSERPVTD